MITRVIICIDIRVVFKRFIYTINSSESILFSNHTAHIFPKNLGFFTNEASVVSNVSQCPNIHGSSTSDAQADKRLWHTKKFLPTKSHNETHIERKAKQQTQPLATATQPPKNPISPTTHPAHQSQESRAHTHCANIGQGPSALSRPFSPNSQSPRKRARAAQSCLRLLPRET